jgi:hypothetical protein
MIQYCGDLGPNKKCESCTEDDINEQPDNQDDMKLKGAEELDSVIEPTNPNFARL